MRPKPRRFTVDWYSEVDAPKVGDVVRDVGLRGTVRGYLRVLSVRQVVVRVSRGESARYALQTERLPGKPPEGASWTMYANPPKPKRDRFSPLLDP